MRRYWRFAEDSFGEPMAYTGHGYSYHLDSSGMPDVFTNAGVGEIFRLGKSAHKGRKLLNYENISLDQGTYPRLFIDS